MEIFLKMCGNAEDYGLMMALEDSKPQQHCGSLNSVSSFSGYLKQSSSKISCEAKLSGLITGQWKMCFKYMVWYMVIVSLNLDGMLPENNV